LAFHPYPQVIGGVFNLHPFGPPLALTPASTCPWIDHLVSGLQQTNLSHFRHSVFATASGDHPLNLGEGITKLRKGPFMAKRAVPVPRFLKEYRAPRVWGGVPGLFPGSRGFPFPRGCVPLRLGGFPGGGPPILQKNFGGAPPFSPGGGPIFSPPPNFFVSARKNPLSVGWGNRCSPLPHSSASIMIVSDQQPRASSVISPCHLRKR